MFGTSGRRMRRGPKPCPSPPLRRRSRARARARAQPSRQRAAICHCNSARGLYGSPAAAETTAARARGRLKKNMPATHVTRRRPAVPSSPQRLAACAAIDGGTPTHRPWIRAAPRMLQRSPFFPAPLALQLTEHVIA
eukprot:351100-Chlamydomonas_euryale.AAC.2